MIHHRIWAPTSKWWSFTILCWGFQYIYVYIYIMNLMNNVRQCSYWSFYQHTCLFVYLVTFTQEYMPFHLSWMTFDTHSLLYKDIIAYISNSRLDISETKVDLVFALFSLLILLQSYNFLLESSKGILFFFAHCRFQPLLYLGTDFSRTLSKLHWVGANNTLRKPLKSYLKVVLLLSIYTY